MLGQPEKRTPWGYYERFRENRKQLISTKEKFIEQNLALGHIHTNSYVILT